MIKKERGEWDVSVYFFLPFLFRFWRRSVAEKCLGREKEELEEGNVKPKGRPPSFKITMNVNVSL